MLHFMSTAALFFIDDKEAVPENDEDEYLQFRPFFFSILRNTSCEYVMSKGSSLIFDKHCIPNYHHI